MSSVRRKNTRPPDLTTSRSSRCGSGLMSWTSASSRLAEVAGAPPLEMRARVLQRLLEAVAAERLQQVVERVDLERLERVLVVGGDEHDRRHRLGADALDHAEAVAGRHLDVEEHQVRAAAAEWPSPPAGRRRTRRPARCPSPAAAGRRYARAPSARRPRPSFGSCSRTPSIDSVSPTASSASRSPVASRSHRQAAAGRLPELEAVDGRRTGARAATACSTARPPIEVGQPCRPTRRRRCPARPAPARSASRRARTGDCARRRAAARCRA